MRAVRASAWALPLGLAIVSFPVVASAQQRRRPGGGTVAPVTTPTITYHNPNLARTRALVEEVIDKLRTLHVDGAKVSPDRCREAAITAFRDHVASNSFHFLAGEARERFRRDLWSFGEGDIDSCIAVIDSHLGLRTPEETWQVTDVLARGAIAATHDPFTQLIDRQTYEMLDMAMMGDRPKGYGLKVVERDGLFVVDHVFRGYDAAEKGVREGDIVVEVDGRPAALLGADEVLKRLGGDARIGLRIFREGFSAGHDVELEARPPRDPNVVSEALTGDVGYIRIDSFLEQTAHDVERAIAALEARRCRTLVLDLRDNPGGEVKACEQVAHLFLEGGSLVCTTVEADGALHTVCCEDGPPRTLAPLVVLTNHATASAAEMLAGALQGHGRARVVGERTHGKDVGQCAFSLASAAQQRFLLVTRIRYFAPRHDLEHPGIPVIPDVEAAPFAFTPTEEDELLALRGAKAFESYLALHAAPDGDRLVALAKDDEGKFDAYPGFASWARGLGTKLTLGTLRRALRIEVRAWAVRQRGCALRTDLRDDVPLKTAYDLAASSDSVPPPPAAPRKAWY